MVTSRFAMKRGVLQVTRTIEGKTDKCSARFDTIAGTDRIPLLRMHFHFDGEEYDATYRWQSDPDNYHDLRLPLSFRHQIAWSRSAFPHPQMIARLSECENLFLILRARLSMLTNG
jgi:hypothetical protein